MDSVKKNGIDEAEMQTYISTVQNLVVGDAANLLI